MQPVIIVGALSATKFTFDIERSRISRVSILVENVHHLSKRGERKKDAASCARMKRTSRIVAQMKFRARDFHRTLLSFSLFPLDRTPFFLFLRRLLLFRFADRAHPRQRRAFPVGEAPANVPTLRRRIFKREEN